MKTLQSGSAHIVVILVSGILISSITLLWRSSLLKTDIARIREQAYCRMYSAQAWARLAVALCIKEYNACYQMLSENEICVMSCQSWPVTATLSCPAQVYAQRKQRSIMVHATIMHEQKPLHTVTCIIQPQESEQGDEHYKQSYSLVQWHDSFG